MKPRVALMYVIPADRMARAADHCARHPWPTGWDNGAFGLTAEWAFHGEDLLIRLLDLTPLPGTEAPHSPDALLDVVRAAADVPGMAAADLPLARAAGVCPAVPVPEEDGTAGPARTRELLRSAHAQVAVPAFWGRITDAALLPGPEVPRRLAALRYPARAGQGEAIQQALSGGRELPVNARPVDGTATTLASTSLFRRGDTVVRLIEVAGNMASGMAHLRRTASRGPGAQRLADLLRPGYDLRTESGFDRFLTTGTLRPVGRPG